MSIGALTSLASGLSAATAVAGTGGLAEIAQIAQAAGGQLIKLGEKVSDSTSAVGQAVIPDQSQQKPKDDADAEQPANESLSEKLKKVFKGFGEKFEGIFKDFGGNFKDLLGGLTDDLGGLFKGLLGELGGLFSGGSLGGLLGGITSLFGFAGGGRIQPGVPAIVGERGPELIVPSRSGTVMNAADSRGAGGKSVSVNQTVNFDLIPSPTISAMIDAKKPEIERAAIAGTLKALSRGGV